MRNQAAVFDHLNQMFRKRLAFERLTRCQVNHPARDGFDFQLVALVDSVGLPANERRQAEVQRVAIENAAERLRQHVTDTEGLQVLRRLLPGGADAEILSGNEHVA